MSGVIGRSRLAAWLVVTAIAVASPTRAASAQETTTPTPTPTPAPAPAPDTSEPSPPVEAGVPSPPSGFEPAAKWVAPVGFQRAQAWTPPPRQKRRSTAMIITGIASGALGLVAVGVGATMFAASSGEQCVVGGNEGLDLRGEVACKRDEPLQTAGIGLMIGGGAAVALGLPLLFIGAQRVPAATTGLRLAPGTLTLAGQF